MATLTVQITSALGTSTKTLTFSGPDATRIMNAYQTRFPGGTQDQLVTFLAVQILQANIARLVALNEITTPLAPVMT